MGYYVPTTFDGGGEQAAFVPNPLPKGVELASSTLDTLYRAAIAIGELRGAVLRLPHPQLFQYTYVGSEALDSSRIEGIQSSLSSILLDQVQGADRSTDRDVLEVRSYITALNLGLERLKEGSALSLFSIREIHRILMGTPNGVGSSPGEFREAQVCIGSRTPGGTLRISYMPPPPTDVMHQALNDLEQYINTKSDIPSLVNIALTHYQFEAIHPFLDGNGRVGRLLVVLQMVQDGLLPYPLLPLSTFLKENQQDYYRFLRSVRDQETYNSWLTYFLDGVRIQSVKSLQQTTALLDLREEYLDRLRGDRSRAIDIVDLIFANPFLVTARVVNSLDISRSGAKGLLKKLQEKNIIHPLAEVGVGGSLNWVAKDMFEIIAPNEELKLAS